MIENLLIGCALLSLLYLLYSANRAQEVLENKIKDLNCENEYRTEMYHIHLGFMYYEIYKLELRTPKLKTTHTTNNLPPEWPDRNVETLRENLYCERGSGDPMFSKSLSKEIGVPSKILCDFVQNRMLYPDIETIKKIDSYLFSVKAQREGGDKRPEKKQDGIYSTNPRKDK